MKFYCGAVLVQKNDSSLHDPLGRRISACPMVCTANSTEEAEGKMLAFARESNFPEELGYFDHKVLVSEVPHDVIVEYVRQLNSK